MFSYIVSDKVFSIEKKFVPTGSYLSSIHLTPMNIEKVDNIPVVKIEAANPHKEFQKVLDFLQFKTQDVNRKILDFLVPDCEHSIYSDIFEREEDFRNKLYKEGYSDHPYNTDPYYGLVKVTQEFWEDLVLLEPNDPNLIDFGKRIKKRDWDVIKAELEELVRYVDENTFVAGGKLFSILFGVKSTDTDLFIYGCDEKKARKKVREIAKKFFENNDALIFDFKNRTISNKNDEYDVNWSSQTRTENCLTLTHCGNVNLFDKVVQIIFRLYKSPSEVLHGFDVDSCCIGFDGEDIWITERCLFSLIFGYNTVNFKRMSPSYETRLVKYANRGMKIYVPGFEMGKVNQGVMRDLREKYFPTPRKEVDVAYNVFNEMRMKPTKMDRVDLERKIIGNLNDNDRLKNGNKFKYLHELKGLTLILFMQDCVKRRATKQITLDNICNERSDYNHKPYHYLGNNGCNLSELLMYVLSLGENLMSTGREYNYYIGNNDSSSYILQNKELAPEIKKVQEAYKLSPFTLADDSIYVKVNVLYREGKHKFLYMRSMGEGDLDYLLNIPEKHYNVLKELGGFFSRKIEFKKINPGEQSTGTFHKLVLDDPSVWYGDICKEDKEIGRQSERDKMFEMFDRNEKVYIGEGRYVEEGIEAENKGSGWSFVMRGAKDHTESGKDEESDEDKDGDENYEDKDEYEE